MTELFRVEGLWVAPVEDSGEPATDRGAAAHHPASSAIPPAATTPANATPVTRSTA